MNNQESSDLGTESNNPTQTQKDTVPFESKNFVDLVSKVLTDSSEKDENPVSEEKNGDVEATTEKEGPVDETDPENALVEDKDADSEETEETKSDDNEIDKGLPKGVKKRIDKLTAKRKEAEAEVERLKSEMERLRDEASQPARVPTKDNPYSHLNSIEQVNREVEQAKQVRRWCEMNPEGAVVRDAQGNEQEYTAEDVRKIKIKALDALEEHLPKQANYLQNYNKFETIVAKEYPWWKDRTSQERAIADTFLKQFPEITKFPDYKMVLGDYIRGVKARESASKKNTTVKADLPPQPRRTATPPHVSPREAKSEVARSKFTQTGNVEHLSDIIANRFL